MAKPRMNNRVFKLIGDDTDPDSGSDSGSNSARLGAETILTNKVLRKRELCELCCGMDSTMVHTRRLNKSVASRYNRSS